MERQALSPPAAHVAICTSNHVLILPSCIAICVICDDGTVDGQGIGLFQWARYLVNGLIHSYNVGGVEPVTRNIISTGVLMARSARKGAKGSGGDSQAGGKAGTVTGYFRQLFANNPKWLKGRSNKAVLNQWLADNPGYTEVPDNIKIAMANAKSAVRSKRKKRRRKKAAGEPAATATAVARTSRPVSKGSRLVTLEEQIDDCLGLAKGMDPERLDEVIKLLRRARNLVVLIAGE
jgi:hypothetical protein